MDAFGKETFHAILQKTSYLPIYITACMHFICNKLYLYEDQFIRN